MWYPQAGHQLAAFEADWCPELFYGGERGGGKSDFQIGYQEDGALRYGNAHRGIMFRKTYAELEELQARAMQVFPGEGAVYKTSPSADYPFSNCWYWPNGASTKMRFIEAERDYGRYHGHQYTRISFDEVTEYLSAAPLLKMLSTLRSPHGVPCSVRLTGNPGGVGHIWVKGRYVDPAIPMTPYEDPESGIIRMYVPSAMADNVILMREDPQYRNRIIAATNGNEALRKAWLEGDWNIIAGAFFECWNSKVHVIEPFKIPDDWGRIRSGDWGSAKPFSFGWWAVASDDYQLMNGFVVPRGSMIRYREFYGCKDPMNEPNVGMKMPAEEVGKRLLEMEQGDPKVQVSVLDPAAFASDGGPSIAERLFRGSNGKLNFGKADNKRVGTVGAMGGWDQMRLRMLGDESPPMIYCFSTCRDSIRTIPLLQHDKTRIEDIDTDMEDHCFASGTLVETDRGAMPIESLTHGHVLTASGEFVPFRSGRLVKQMAELARVTFANGEIVTCTPDHRFLISKNEWCYAKDLANRRVLCVLPSLAKRSRNSWANAITDAVRTFSAKVSAFIGWSMRPMAGSSPEASMFTAGTKTDPIINPKTWNAYQGASTSEPSMAKPQVFVPKSIYQKLGKLPLNGIVRKKVESGIRDITNSTSGLTCIKSNADALSVHSHSKPIALTPQKPITVAEHAGNVLCVSVERSPNKGDVYCITVPSTGCFALKGGMIVSNCADDWRYACMSRPIVRKSAAEKKPRFLHEMTANEVFWPEKQSKRAISDRI